MSRPLVTIGAIALGFATALVLGFFLFVRPTTGVATLIHESGTVFLKTPKDADYTAVSGDETAVPNGSMVKTAEGMAHIIFPNGTRTSLDTNTEVRVSVENGNTTIFQAVGTTWHRVQKLLGKEYRVETPSTVATVRGTEFSVQVAKDADIPDTIYVTESTVEVGEKSQKDGKTVALNIQPVTTGKVARMKRETPTTAATTGQTVAPQQAEISDMPQEMEQTKWYKRNKHIQKSFAGKHKPKEILRELRQDAELKEIDKLQTKRGEDLLGAQSIRQREFEKIAQYLEQTDTDEQACNQLKATPVDILLKDVNSVQDTIGGDAISELRTLVLSIARSCQDGHISPEEFQLLRPMVAKLTGK